MSIVKKYFFVLVLVIFRQAQYKLVRQAHYKLVRRARPYRTIRSDRSGGLNTSI